MNQEELTKSLPEKYDGYFRKIEVHYVDYQYIPSRNEELKEVYIITWRPWFIKSETNTKVIYSCEDLHHMTIKRDELDTRIDEIFAKLDSSKAVSPEEAGMLKGCKTMFVQAPPRNLD